jgi:hypothetical protein
LAWLVTERAAPRFWKLHGDYNARQTMTTKRTTHRSSTGTKLYAVRDKKGRFKDIQTYKRAHTADMKRKSKTEK